MMEILAKSWISFLVLAVISVIVAYIVLFVFSTRVYLPNYIKDDHSYRQKHGSNKPNSHPLVPILIFWILSLVCVIFYIYLYIAFVHTSSLKYLFFYSAFALLVLEFLYLELFLLRQGVYRDYKDLVTSKSDTYGFKDAQNHLELAKKDKFYNEEIETNYRHCQRRPIKSVTSGYYLNALAFWPYSTLFYTSRTIESIDPPFAKSKREYLSLKNAIEETNSAFIKQGTYGKSLLSALADSKRNIKAIKNKCIRLIEIGKSLLQTIEYYNQKNLELARFDEFDERLAPFCAYFEDIKNRYVTAINTNYQEQIDMLNKINAYGKIGEISRLLNKICLVDGGENYINELDFAERRIELKTINDVLKEYEPNGEIINTFDNQIEKMASSALNINVNYYSFFTKYYDEIGRLLDEQLYMISSLQGIILKEKNNLERNIIELSVEVRVNHVNDLDAFVKEKYDHVAIKKLASDILDKKRQADSLLSNNFEKLLKNIIEEKDYEVLDLFVKENRQLVLKYRDYNNNNFLHLLIPDGLNYLSVISDDEAFTSFFFESNFDGVVPLDYLDSVWLERIVDLDKSSVDLSRLKIQSASTKAENLAFSEKYLAYIYENSSYNKQLVIKSVNLQKTSKHEYETIAKYMHKAAYKRFNVEKVLTDLSPYRNYLPFHFSTLFGIYEKMISNINKGEFVEAQKRMYLIKRCSGLFVSSTLKKMVKDVSIKAKDNIVYEQNEIVGLLNDIDYVSKSPVSDTLGDEIYELRDIALVIAKRMYEKDPKEDLFDAINALDSDFHKENSWYDEYLAILGLTKPVTIDDIRHAYNMKRIELRNRGASMEEITELNEVYNRLLRQ